MSRRLCFALDLVADESLIREYERRHAAGSVWPKVVRDIRDRGVENMEIWRLADRMVMIADVSDDYPRQSDSSVQHVVEQWEAEMSRFQHRILDHGEKWAAMTCIFRLSEQVG